MLRQKNSKVTASRGLSFWSYQLEEKSLELAMEYSSQTFEFLSALGLPVSPEIEFFDRFEEVKEFCKKWINNCVGDPLEALWRRLGCQGVPEGNLGAKSWFVGPLLEP